MPTKTTDANFAQRFWSKVNKTEGCWVWTAARDTKGYGRSGFEGRGQRTHRIVWQLFYGPIPPGMEVCHKCDNPPCCNPDHLFLGTQADNMQDMVAKGRHGMWTKPESRPTGKRAGVHTHPEKRARGARSGKHTHPESYPRGEQFWSARLTEEAVRDIRQRRAAGVAVATLAREYGISKNSIYRLLSGRSWKHVL